MMMLLTMKLTFWFIAGKSIFDKGRFLGPTEGGEMGAYKSLLHDNLLLQTGWCIFHLDSILDLGVPRSAPLLCLGIP